MAIALLKSKFQKKAWLPLALRMKQYNMQIISYYQTRVSGPSCKLFALWYTSEYGLLNTIDHEYFSKAHINSILVVRYKSKLELNN